MPPLAPKTYFSCFFLPELITGNLLIGISVESFPFSVMFFRLEPFILRGVLSVAPVRSSLLPIPGDLLVLVMVILLFLHRFLEVSHVSVPCRFIHEEVRGVDGIVECSTLTNEKNKRSNLTPLFQLLKDRMSCRLVEGVPRHRY